MTKSSILYFKLTLYENIENTGPQRSEHLEHQKKEFNSNETRSGRIGTKTNQQNRRFQERLEALMPSLIEHRCSEGVRGGFLCGWTKVPGWVM